jgi:hypothetical protein
LYGKERGKILKTVDAVHQAIASEEDCQDLCNNAPFRCHSYDYNDTGDNVCRLSHHSAVTLTQVPYGTACKKIIYDIRRKIMKKFRYVSCLEL